MTLLVDGNTKIHHSIKCFALPPIITCPNHKHCGNCCYALKAFQQYPNARNAWMRNFEISKDGEHFVRLILTELPKSKSGVVRIHVSGDFYSDYYAKMWGYITIYRPNYMFYGYTKAIDPTVSDLEQEFPSLILLSKYDNVNLINSIADDGLPNFGPPLRVFQLKGQGYHLCPATIPKSKTICGLDCVHCHTKGNDKVVFYKH